MSNRSPDPVYELTVLLICGTILGAILVAAATGKESPIETCRSVGGSPQIYQGNFYAGCEMR